MEMDQKRIDLQKEIGKLNDLIRKASLLESRKFLVEVLVSLRGELKSRGDLYSKDEKDLLFATGVSLRGILDYINIRQIIETENWLKDTKLLDLVWTRMCDCRDRIESYPGLLQGVLVSSAESLLKELEKFYYENFGHGLYMSPEIKVKKRICSICKENIKLCDHIPGRLYGGIMARQIMAEMEPISVSIVENPEDLRCRMWPWNFDEKTSGCTVPILSIFYVDDFIQDEQWPKEGIQWPHGV